jgi:hypothetical protein
MWENKKINYKVSLKMTGILQDCTCHESSNNIYTHYYNNHFVPESTTYDFTFNNIPYVTLK